MTDIAEMPTVELLDDLRAARLDIITCQDALAVSVLEYKGKSVRARLADNLRIEKRILDELKRRNALN